MDVCYGIAYDAPGGQPPVRSSHCAARRAAVLTNKYTFNDGTANDSVGGQDGTVVDNTGIACFAGGAVDLSGNNGVSSNQDFALPTTVGAFVDLPNGLIPNCRARRHDGQLSLEIWFTTQQNRNWAEVYSFGGVGAGRSRGNVRRRRRPRLRRPDSAKRHRRCPTSAPRRTPPPTPRRRLLAQATPLPSASSSMSS